MFKKSRVRTLPAMLLLILFLLSLKSNGQSNKIDYAFLNEAIKQIDSSKLLLSQSTYIPYLDKSHIKLYFKSLKGKISYAQFAEIVENYKWTANDTFQQGYLKNITLLSDKQLSSIQEKNRQTSYNRTFYYHVSIPVFDKKKNYAVVDFAKGVASLEMQGCYYLFKRTNGNWKLIARFNCWIS